MQISRLDLISAFMNYDQRIPIAFTVPATTAEQSIGNPVPADQFARQARDLFDDSRALDEKLATLNIPPIAGMNKTYAIRHGSPGWLPVMMQMSRDLDLMLGSRAGKDICLFDIVKKEDTAITSLQFLEMVRSAIDQSIAEQTFNPETFHTITAQKIPISEVFKNEVYEEHGVKAAPVFSVDTGWDFREKTPSSIHVRIMSAESGPPLKVCDERSYKMDFESGDILLETFHCPISRPHTGP